MAEGKKKKEERPRCEGGKEIDDQKGKGAYFLNRGKGAEGDESGERIRNGRKKSASSRGDRDPLIRGKKVQPRCQR